MENQLTRREFLKSAAIFGAGMCLGCHEVDAQPGRGRTRDVLPILPNNPAIRHYHNRCRSRNCLRCIKVCRDEMTVFGQTVPHGEDTCIYCGQCTLLCPREAITEQYHYRDVAQAIADPDKIVVASIAPAVRVSLGEMYGLAHGMNVERKIVGSLKKLGVDYVLDVTFSADLTVVEEASELLMRLEKNGRLPMFTSCCPAWVRFVKLFYPKFLPNLSTAKSPILMQGALVKTYFAQKTGINPAKIVNVALTPCTAKKAEILLPKMNAAGTLCDIDFTLTCRELAYLINDNKINFPQTQDAPYNSLMGTGSGAGVLFGGTGGVTEAALRTAYRLLNGKNPPADFFNLQSIRGFSNIRQANVSLGKRMLNVAVVHGIANARQLLASIQNGTQKYDFVEVMACSGGCVGGGGQPINRNMDTARLKQLRRNALYQRDANNEIHLSYDNPQIQTIYKDFLGECINACPKQVIGKVVILWHKHIVIRNGTNCMGCNKCIKICPHGVFVETSKIT